MTMMHKFRIKNCSLLLCCIMGKEMIPKAVKKTGQSLKLMSFFFEVSRKYGRSDKAFTMQPLTPSFICRITIAAVLVSLIFPVYHQNNR